MPDALVVLAVVDEDLQVDTDLVGGQAHALGGALAGEHVGDQLLQLLTELGDVLALLCSTGLPTTVIGREVPRSRQAVSRSSQSSVSMT